MKGKSILKASVGVGAAALLGISSPGCSNDQGSTSNPTTPEEQTVEPIQAETAQPEPAQPAPEAAQPAPTQPAPEVESSEEQASEEQQASSGSTEGQPTKVVDCTGPARYTEACGYASPTRYAVLDPTTIVNS